MKVFIVSCVFPPEPVVSARTSFDIAEGLTQKRNGVTVITSFPNRPEGRLYSEYDRRRPFLCEVHKVGFRIIRCFSFPSTKSRMFSRFMENLSFGITSSLVVLTLPKADVVYANSWPVFATELLFFVAKLRRMPLVLNIQDIYPESLVLQHRVKENSLLVRFMRWIDNLVVRQANAVIVISKQFTRIYQNQCKLVSNKLCIVPNWGPAIPKQSEAETSQFRNQKGIPHDSFVLFLWGQYWCCGWR